MITEQAIQPVHVERNVPYGSAPIGDGGSNPRERRLTMDVYRPASADAAEQAGRPALLLAHGGAYHRGAKEEDLFEQDGCYNTPVAEYCRRFAARGFVCCSIGYRLTQEAPPPPAEPVRRASVQGSGGRMTLIREVLGLPAATAGEMVNGQEAAFADVAAAFRFVADNAVRFGIDPTRIAIGGFSAGAFCSAYAAYALRVPAAAVVSLSGGMEPEDAEHYIDPSVAELPGWPPLLLFVGEHDLPGVPERSARLAARLHGAGIGYRHYRVPGAPHFYAAHSVVQRIASNYPGGPMHGSVEEAMRQFLWAALRLDTMPGAAAAGGYGTPDEAMLQGFADAWNRHDLDGLMTFMTDDCEFRSSAGPQSGGTVYQGREAVRAGFAKAWADIPDARWTGARHFVMGNRGVSEWTFVGTRASDGAPIEVDGCDLFTFSGGRIRVKNSWRKQRG